jgi:hypothetical protein
MSETERDDGWPKPTATGRLLCGRCGIILVREGKGCSCGAPSATSVAAPATEGSCWVRVTCTFTCRVCGLPAPLEHLDMDGIVYCPSCGNEQAFAVEAWKEALRHAHAVGDLAGSQPDLPGGSPFASLGVQHVFADDVGRVLRVRASPGHPLCRLCAEPLGSKTEGKLLSAWCPACGEKGVYERPAPADTIEPHLQGVIAVGNRSGALEARDNASPGGGAVALSCPACAADLPAPGEQQMVTCPFCGVTSRVPPHLWRRLRPARAEPQPFWLLFANPSLRRGELRREAEARRWQDEEAAIIEGDRVERERRAPGEARRAQLMCFAMLAGLVLFFIFLGVVFPRLVVSCRH